MRTIIFFGAGKFAKENLSRWEKEGLFPVCFVDSNKDKHDKPYCGIMVYSLEYAISKYPDYDIYLTVGVDLLGNVTEYLTRERTIPSDRIKYPDEVEKRLGCKFIGTRIQFYGDRFGTCGVKNAAIIPYSEDFAENIKKHEVFCCDLISELRLGKETNCDNCSQLRYDIWPVKPKLETIGFDTAFKENKCNFKCIYCIVHKPMEDSAYSLNLIEAFRSFDKMGKNKHLSIVLASGEITVSPYRDEVFDTIKNNRWRADVFTNASVFNQKLADLMNDGLANIQVSIDAGTPETFAKIKGIDCWDKIVSNLQKYADSAKSHAQIGLKYIFLPGINDNNVNVEGFVEIAGRLSATVTISSDYNYINIPISKETYENVLRLLELCHERGIRCDIVTEFFNPQSYKQLTEDFPHLTK